MQFSVLMPVYHGDKIIHIKEALDSVLSQTLLPSEVVIIVDGPVSNETIDLLHDFSINESILNVHYLEENKGLGEVLHIGVKVCSYDVIARMDADDICRKDRFEKQINFLKNNPNIDIVGSYINEFDTDPSVKLNVRKVPVYHHEIVHYSKRRNPLNHMTVMFKKQAVLDAGNYQTFISFEDYYLWVRMIKNGMKIHNIPDSLVFARTGQDMYMRRGGFKYLLNDVKLQWYFLVIGHTNIFQYVSNILVRVLVRSVPNNIRAVLYSKLFRS